MMVFPVQLRGNALAELDRELAFALSQIGDRVAWLLPDQLGDALARSPGTGLQLEGLPVEGFLSGELRRVGDPLFGNVYRLGALVDATYALVPVRARSVVSESGQVVEISATVLEVRTGRVLWFGVVEGTAGPPGDPASAASAVEALARRVAG